ncbi:hypothetical protein [Peribacillus simplex]|uniref:hypothetical protein n=1 Tax=Peribacillus simplex TaxID=1478 RepID=UPI0024C16542|nr:hypothetical protein [Peribacillus simplex]WHY55239.1 hypothetical protein QNH43_19030 [Peribacillus simplex]
MELNSTNPQKNCRQKEFYLTVKTKLIGAGVRDSCLEKRVQGRPRRREASRRLPDRPRKASAWSGNQQTKNYRQKEFYLTVKTKLIGAEGTRLLREKRVQGRPRRREALRRLPDRPRKASAWSGNQQTKNCRQKEFYLTVKTKLIGAEGTRLLREKRVQGRPRRREASRRLPDHPRKASAWSGNQQSLKKTAGKPDFLEFACSHRYKAV